MVLFVPENLGLFKFWFHYEKELRSFSPQQDDFDFSKYVRLYVWIEFDFEFFLIYFVKLNYL